jgi:hypothetical protein
MLLVYIRYYAPINYDTLLITLKQFFTAMIALSNWRFICVKDRGCSIKPTITDEDFDIACQPNMTHTNKPLIKHLDLHAIIHTECLYDNLRRTNINQLDMFSIGFN